MQVTGSNQNLYKSLSIRLCTDGFSFFVSSPEGTNTYIPYFINPTISLSANLKEAITQLPELQESYKKVQVLITGPSSMVPFELFEEERINDLYNFNFPHRKGGTVLYNILPKSNTTILFSLDKSAFQLINETYPHAKYYSVESPVIEYLTEKSKLRETQKLYVYFHERTLNIYIFNNGKLYFANNFTYTELNDAIYFVLQIWKSQGLNQFTDELHLMGVLPDEESTRKELRRYIKQVYQNNPVAEFGLKAEEAQLQIPYDLQILIHRGI